MPRFPSTLAVALAGVFAVSFFAYGQLGGPDGIVVPYQGRLEQGGVPVNGVVTLTLDLFPDGSAASACHTQSFSVAVVDGVFSLQLTNVPLACARGQEPQLAISVDDGGGPVALGGRQRIFPAYAATTSGAGDFAVTSAVVVGDPASPTVALRNNVSADSMIMGSNVVGNLHIDSNTPARGGDGSLYLNYYADRAVKFGYRDGAAAAVIDDQGNLDTAGEVAAAGLVRVDAPDGALGASHNFFFRDTGDSWLRLRSTLDVNPAYADLAVGNSHVNGDSYVGNGVSAPNNQWDTCAWTGWVSEEQGPAYCPNGRYAGAIQCSGSYCDSVRLYCCTL